MKGSLEYSSQMAQHFPSFLSLPADDLSRPFASLSRFCLSAKNICCTSRVQPVLDRNAPAGGPLPLYVGAATDTDTKFASDRVGFPDAYRRNSRSRWGVSFPSEDDQWSHLKDERRKLVLAGRAIVGYQRLKALRKAEAAA